ncbi:MAG: hypothetical protein JWO06_1800 [Bacteroidota bacterium]|nr:hypothetical protein [Bacteroidota bacterium]
MIFVTGATGFLGSYLVKNLISKGEKVRALKRNTSSLKLLGDFAKNVEWVDGDVLDVPSLENAIEGVEKIYHCAGIFAAHDREKGMAINAEGTANVFNIALDKQVKKVLHVSSTIALGLPLNGQMMDENYYSPTEKLKFDYFKSKRLGELEAWRANAEGLDVVIVNPAGLLGAGPWSTEPLNTFKIVYNGLSFYTEGSNAFVDVRDAAEVMVRLMNSEINGERFILTSENIGLKDYLCQVADALKVKRPGYQLSNALGQLAWRYEGLKSLITGTKPSFTKDDLTIARIPFTYSNAKVLAATGFTFRPLSESIRDTAQSFIESEKKGLDYGTFN